MKSEKLILQKIVDEMMKEDRFSKWLGITIVKIDFGYSLLRMKVKNEMLNGFEICHGGVIFSLADSALAFASNSYGKMGLSISNNISFITKAHENDELTAEAKEISKTNKISSYRVEIVNQRKELVASFNGTVYLTKKNHLEKL